ncbi:MAG: hypothetical protein ACP5UI_04820, partial [Thermoprotei archaeon]
DDAGVVTLGRVKQEVVEVVVVAGDRDGGHEGWQDLGREERYPKRLEDGADGHGDRQGEVGSAGLCAAKGVVIGTPRRNVIGVKGIVGDVAVQGGGE